MFVKITQDEIDFLCILISEILRKNKATYIKSYLKKLFKKLEFEPINFRISGFNDTRYISVDTLKEIDDCITTLNLRSKIK